VVHQRISLVADQAESAPGRGRRSPSDPPAPLRPSVTATATPPPVSATNPIRTPVTQGLASSTEEAPNDRDTPSEGGDS
ncbi:MAG TPA: hypothetical protein VGP93_06780, partial [Polyangiaceae bacterium]|nr:hypothetical protein [Polyangiaceae bacterium]